MSRPAIPCQKKNAMADGIPPAVSVIVCSHNRPAFLERALRSVLCQRDADFEVILVDDGSDPRVETGCRDARLRSIRTEHRGTGAARAAGLRAARGEFVAYCDDDDEWAPGHLAVLHAYLSAHPEVVLVYGDSWWVQDGEQGPVAYSIDYDDLLLARDNYIFASDVMHRADAARASGGFDPSLLAYEDWDLWLRMSRQHSLRHLPVVVGKHHWHGDNVAAGDHWAEWQRVYDAQQSRMIAAGRPALHGLLMDGVQPHPFDRTTWSDSRRELIWHSVLRSNEGYGSAGRQLLLALEREDIDITVAPTKSQTPAGFERFHESLTDWGKLALYYDYRVEPGVLPAERIVSYAMWESTAVPSSHIEEINAAATLHLVPCQQNLESYRACGLRVPMRVLHHGMDPSKFPMLMRRSADVFTFGTFGDLAPRKGIDVLIRAFQHEFASDEPVRLLVKGTSSTAAYAVDDPRMEFVSGFMERQTLLEFLQRMDVFVLPSRGEGFGLCGLEAMATGLPLIATNWGGPADYLDDADGFPLSYRLVETNGIASNHVRYDGLWAEPDEEHLRFLMRWLYEHPAEARAKGTMAAKRVHEHWTWDRAAADLCRYLDEVASW